MSCVTRALPRSAVDNHIFPSLPFATSVLREALLIALNTPCQIQQIQIQEGFGFPNHISARLDSVSIFLPSYLSLLPPSV